MPHTVSLAVALGLENSRYLPCGCLALPCVACFSKCVVCLTSALSYRGWQQVSLLDVPSLTAASSSGFEYFRCLCTLAWRVCGSGHGKRLAELLKQVCGTLAARQCLEDAFEVHALPTMSSSSAAASAAMAASPTTPVRVQFPD